MWIQVIIVEAESAGSGDVAAAEANDVNIAVDNSDEDGDHGENDGHGELRRHQFDKSVYTFSAAAGRALQQQQATDNIRNLV